MPRLGVRGSIPLTRSNFLNSKAWRSCRAPFWRFSLSQIDDRVARPEIRRNQAPFSREVGRGWATMCRYLALLFFLTLVLTLPAHAYDAKRESGSLTNETKAKPLRGSSVLAVDQITGGCEVRKVGTDAEMPLGVKLLGTYDREDLAKKAEASFPACKNGPSQDEKRDALKQTEKNCEDDTRKDSNSLVGLFSGLASNAAQQAKYFDCMKANGYDAKR
jgi:hypothetical protein